MLRFILTFGYLAVFLTLGAPFCLIEEYLCKKKGTHIDDIKAWKCIRNLFRTCTFLSGANVIYKGQENIPTDTPVLYTPNHKGYFDIILSYRGFAGPTGYVAKKELDFFSLGIWMKHISCIFLDREDPKSAVEMIKEVSEKFKRGVSICIFPEGTRCKEKDAFLDFHNGSFKPALRAKVPIVPVAITGSRDMWENHFPFVRPSRVIIEFGKPIYPEELSRDDQKRIGEIVREKVFIMYNNNLKAIGEND